MEDIVHKKGKIYYSMGEVAEMFDVNPSLIRFWEKKFDILKPHKNKKGNRMFTPSDVDNLKLIYHLVKEKGMTLLGAQKVLKGNREGTIRDMEIAERLLAIKAMLVEIREELKTEGELFSPEGYLDEDTSEGGILEGGIAHSEKEKSKEEGFILFTEDVRVEVVTDGSSPWAKEGSEDAEADENEKSADGPQRQAAMEELRNIKSILDGWDEIDEASTDEQDTEETEDLTVEFLAISGPGTASGNPFGIDEDENDYSDPWEEIGEEVGESATSESEIPNGGKPLPGDLFGTDVCTTFSNDDREAMVAEEEKEEKERPGIYEQTLF